jgi:DNA-binding FrmR family transcriptional regulator
VVEKDFNGSIKDAIIKMLENDTDCCEVTHIIGDVAVTVELTIVKIAADGEIVYDAATENEDVDFSEDDDEDSEDIDYEEEDDEDIIYS